MTDLEKSPYGRGIPTPPGAEDKGSVLVREFDENGHLATVYEGYSGASLSSRSAKPKGAQRGLWNSSSAQVLQNLINVFLPTGYPHSVSADYIDYQIYDSIQAFSSSIAGLFANRAVLSAVGVGDDSATSTAALFMKVIQETVGRLGTILFAWKLGSALEPECKKYRFMADLVNDSAIVFDCLSSLFPGSKRTKILLLCMSGLLRSVCGVMAGGSRAALTQHFTDPVRGSIADVNAKDQSQETVITLMGMLAGSALVGIVQGEGLSMWITVLLLLGIHLWTNYQAVAHVVARTINRQRANIVFSDVMTSLHELEHANNTDAHSTKAMSRVMLSPKQVSVRERILEADGLLRWYNATSKLSSVTDHIVGHCSFGTFDSVLSLVPSSTLISDLFNVCECPQSGYILYYRQLTHSKRVNVRIALVHYPSGTEPFNADIRAWVHALLIAKKVHDEPMSSPFEVIESTRQLVNRLFDQLQIEEALAHCGWELDRNSILSFPPPSFSLSNDPI